MKYSLLIFPLIFLISCINFREKNKVESQNSVKEIIIEPNYDKELPYDSIIESIKLIPLETNKNCLIRNPFKVLIKNDYIFIQNFFDNILVFDLNGKFIRKIGNQGKGPSEYLKVNDFDFDEDMNIHINDERKILIFNFTGDPIKSIKLNIKKNGFTMVPQQFAVAQNGGYYFWETPGPGLAQKNIYFLNHINSTQQIVEERFPIKRMESFNPDRFHRFGDYINITPPYWNDTIYSAGENEISANYCLNFEERTFKGQIPEWEDYRKFKEDISNKKYVEKITNFVETDHWIFFSFVYLKYRYNAFYSKTLNRTYVNLPKPTDPPNKSLFWKIDGEWEGKMIALVEPAYLVEKVKHMKEEKWKKNFTQTDYKIMKQLETIKLIDNPVLVVCELKKY